MLDGGIGQRARKGAAASGAVGANAAPSFRSPAVSLSAQRRELSLDVVENPAVSEALRINHVRVAGTDYSETRAWLKASFGLDSFDVIPLGGGGQYRQGIAPVVGLTALELFVDIDPAHPFATFLAAQQQSVSFVGWALRTDDIDAVGRRVGRDPSPSRSWVDARGEAFSATWIMSGLSFGLPYFIQYDVAPASWPPVEHSEDPGSIAEVLVCGTDEELTELREWVGNAPLPLKLEARDPPLRIAAVTLDRGQHHTVVAPRSTQR